MDFYLHSINKLRDTFTIYVTYCTSDRVRRFSFSTLYRHGDFIDVEHTVVNERIIKNKSANEELLTSVTISITRCERTQDVFGGEG